LTPGQEVSTMKAEIFFVCGSAAITTKSSASVPFVHQSFSPSGRSCRRPALGHGGAAPDRIRRGSR
jgi:hypothetical protein